MSIIDSLLDKFIPYDCVACGAEGLLLCSTCSDKLPAAKVDHPISNLGSVEAYTLYEGAAKDLIWKLKSGGAQAAALTMAHLMASLVPKVTDCVIVPVPTASSRARQRGYDQAKLIGRALSRQTGLTYIDCLARSGQAHQVGASREQRLQQLSGSLRVKKPSKIKDARVILIDDVTTTGATLELAASILKNAGVAQVQALTFVYAE